MRNAIFYLTYNGVYNFTNGIGTQTQLLISGLEALRERLTESYSSIDLHVVCPAPDANTWGYDPAFYQRQQERLTRLGGYVHPIPYRQHPNQDLWEIPSWEALCQNVAPLLHTQTAAYGRSLIICVDQPWLQTPYALRIDQSLTSSHQIDILLVLFSTTFVRHWGTPDATEFAWEQHGLEASRPGSRIALAEICPSFTSHLKTNFRLPAPQFAPYTSSILLDDPTFALEDEIAVRTTLEAYGVPLDADLILAFGRAAPLKGFEQLIPALAPLRERIHFVLISVPFLNHDPQQRVYDELLRQHRIRATHIKRFSRDLPRALCQWPRTKIVAIPSRHETFSNIPLEVALWARERGPVVVTSAAGGFVDQIEPGITGFFIDILSCEQITQTLRLVLDLSAESQAAIRQRAYQRVVRLYDFKQNFPVTLQWFWNSTAEPARQRS
ncbi:MAG TPA: glycosyltransferase family 4 protein [Candidatus Binataceae bacterium]|nr:glycosyltransferase family 4 protein [Candidatus Binataceae bacterium]